ncbi:MAG: hypothetical protein HYZ44_16980 [Bacteroidetes bacterium]|nr:hypothetical protein [Bacteroidota bacterium]
MKKSQLSFIIIILLYQTTFCQDYIVKDSTYTSGTVKLLSDGSITFKKLISDVPTTYSPDEVKEFGFEGKVFESILINSKNIFKERIAYARPLKVFVNEDQLIVRVNDSVRTVNKKDLIQLVQKYSSCGSYQLPKKILSSRKSIGHNLNMIVKSCKPRGILFTRTTLLFSINQLEVKGDGGLLTAERVVGKFTSPSIGIGKEFPFYKPKNLFLTTELNVNLLSGKISSNTNTTKQISAHYILLPIGLKWVIANYRIKPYLKGGFLPSYSTISTSTGVASSSSSALQFGLTSAIGIQIPIQTVNAFQLELRSTDLAKASFQEYELGMTGTSFSIVYCF